MASAGWLLPSLLVAATFCVTASAASRSGDGRYVVTRYGATGTDVRKDTTAFQKAVDRCAADGGGTVVVPAGQFTLGRVVLKTGVTLLLVAGAELHPSADRADYPPVTGSPDSAYQAAFGENALNNRYALLYAVGARGVTICGSGRIVGDGKRFWKPKGTGDFEKWNCTAPWFYFTPNPFRPVLIILEECDNATLRDVTIEDSPCYAAWFAGCRSLRIRDVAVRNDPAGPNTDGFHFSSCRNVHVSGCDFVCGDDCIAIDPNHHGAASGFSISDCTFRTTVNVFRIYTGLDTQLAPGRPRGSVSDVVASNCTVSDASGVLNVTAEAGDIRRLAFSGFAINMDLRGSALFFLTRAEGTIRDVSVSNMAVRTDGAGVISGEDGGTVSGVTLSDIRMNVCPRTKLYGNGLPDPVPSYAIHHFAPYNLYIRHARDIRLRDVQINWGEADLADLPKAGGHPEWPALECHDVSGLDVDGLVCRQYGNGAAAVLLGDTRDVKLAGCRAQDGAGTFLRLAGVCANVELSGCDLMKCADAVVSGPKNLVQAVVQRGNRLRR